MNHLTNSICEMMDVLQQCVSDGDSLDAIMIAEYLKRRLAGGIGDIPLNELIEKFAVAQASHVGG